MVINRKFILLHFAVVVLLVVALIMLYPHAKKEPGEKISVPVYFVKKYGENDYKLIYVRRKIYKDEPVLKIAISELLRGPAENEEKLGYFTEIPENTKLIELREAPQRIILNLSKEFGQGGGSSSMSLRLEQLVNTALDNVEKKPVYLEIESEQVKYLGGEGISVPRPLTGNINKGRDI